MPITGDTSWCMTDKHANLQWVRSRPLMVNITCTKVDYNTHTYATHVKQCFHNSTMLCYAMPHTILHAVSHILWCEFNAHLASVVNVCEWVVIVCFKKRKSHFSSFRATSNLYGIDHSDRWPTPFHWNLTSRTFPILSRLVFWDTSENIFILLLYIKGEWKWSKEE